MSGPISLAGFFQTNEEEDDENALGSDNGDKGEFEQIFEVANLSINGELIQIRQFSWHRANANQVWPGTFRLADYILDNFESYKNLRMLELGAATGALSIVLQRRDCEVVTSDIEDGGDVCGNIDFNFKLNGISFHRHVSTSNCLH